MSARTEWVAAGRPWNLCQPGVAIRDILGKNYGYTVYAYPDDEHLAAIPPEDHTPYSATGWPVPSPRWYGHAVDIMPEPGELSLPNIARQIIKDKDAGRYPSLKYMNWTDENGVCRHESWQPDHETRSSTDKGHIHLSFRSDHTHSTSADSYDPVARFKEEAMSLTPAEHQWTQATKTRQQALAKGTRKYPADWTSSTTDEETHWGVGQLYKVDDVLKLIADTQVAVGTLAQGLAQMISAQNALAAMVQELLDRPPVTPTPIAGAVTVTGTLQVTTDG